MTPQLTKAIEHFCRMIPDAKAITGYSNNALDDKRLAIIAYWSFKNAEDVTVEDFVDGLLQAKSGKGDVKNCAQGAYEYCMQIKRVLPAIESAGYLK